MNVPPSPSRSCLRRSAGRIAAKRRGVAAVEFAVCLPVLILLVFGAIEAASFIFLKQSLNVAAYEGCREAIRSTGSNAEAQTKAVAILDARNVRDAQVRFVSGDVAAINRGEKVVLEVSAPTRANSPLAGQFIDNRDLTARVVMVKE
ncbi:TadE/TadG family type IV pilus assembly protein [Roseimaritima ulvae]|uniref:TadE-like protein n=1 Tax=Roseimaritima ulvae TaxID=980254 RepID=A0A5B9QQG7_9BACT|nr:TadE family protein [Roseimaritima ulvae]QEG39900.1 TadE-like protein [Roseimaritima ulvae]